MYLCDLCFSQVNDNHLYIPMRTYLFALNMRISRLSSAERSKPSRSLSSPTKVQSLKRSRS